MSWVAEILRKQHRVCSRCRLGPTHLYNPAPSAGEAGDHPEAESSGTPLCNACLELKMTQDLARFDGRCLIFEPALGPEAFTFHALADETASVWPPEHRTTAIACLDRMQKRCSACENPGRFLWIPVEADANLWSENWLSCLHEGTLSPAETLCGRCAARRLVRAFDERGLYFEAIVPPSAGDGMLFCSEFY